MTTIRWGVLASPVKKARTCLQKERVSSEGKGKGASGRVVKATLTELKATLIKREGRLTRRNR